MRKRERDEKEGEERKKGERKRLKKRERKKGKLSWVTSLSIRHNGPEKSMLYTGLVGTVAE